MEGWGAFALPSYFIVVVASGYYMYDEVWRFEVGLPHVVLRGVYEYTMIQDFGRTGPRDFFGGEESERQQQQRCSY